MDSHHSFASRPSTGHIVQQNGNYKRLICYQKSVVVYDLTYHFCETYLQRSKDRTVDQMVQAARSGKQNIAEGSTDGATSTEMELKLLNVANGSLDELREDYEDWLRVRGHRQWDRNGDEMKALWELGQRHSDPRPFVALAESRPPETVANMAIGMINQAQYFLRKLIAAKERKFLTEGGIRERMHAERLKAREEQRRAVNWNGGKGDDGGKGANGGNGSNGGKGINGGNGSNGGNGVNGG